MHYKINLFLTGAMLLLSGCFADRRDNLSGPPSVRSDPSSSSAGSELPNLSPLIYQTRQDLSRRLGLPLEKIGYVGSQPFTWGDVSLGCPQPGVEYAMAIISGYIIRLQAAGRDFVYHTDRNDKIVLCGEDVEKSLQGH